MRDDVDDLPDELLPETDTTMPDEVMSVEVEMFLASILVWIPLGLFLGIDTIIGGAIIAFGAFGASFSAYLYHTTSETTNEVEK